MRGKRWIMLILWMAITFAGCSGRKAETNSETSETTQFEFLESGEMVWEDNKTDDLYAVINLPTKTVTAEGELEGGSSCIFVGEGGYVNYKNHIFNKDQDSWSGVNGVSAQGTEFSRKIVVDQERKGTQIHELGPVSGKNGYVACYYAFLMDGADREYAFYELDGNFQSMRQLKVKLKNNIILYSLMGDAEGNFHLTYQKSSGKYVYAVLSREGEEIFSADVEHTPRLCAYGKGEVALCDEQTSDSSAMERRFYRANLNDGVLTELACSKDEAIRKKMGDYVFSAAPVSETVIAWCDQMGIYYRDVQKNETWIAYRWTNHGIKPLWIDDLTVLENGDVGLCFQDENGRNYVLLQPTEEKEELASITMAVSPHYVQTYLNMAALFHKYYPKYVIEIKDDYDELSLMTQLGAGNGPVLIDTELTGFDNLQNLWQPLDGFLEQSGLTEELYPEALEFGKINGVTYGIVKDFRIETLLVPKSGPEDWDYEGFLKALENFKGAALTYWAMEASADMRERYFDVFKNSMDDSYYFDLETGSVVFGTPEFERALKLSEKARKCPPADDGKALQNGSALCEHVDVLAFSQVIRLRRRLQENGERAIGYPMSEGARHRLIARNPVAMRSTATEEEKLIGYTFLRFMLSEEALKTPENGYLSVRKDVLEYQFHQYEESIILRKENGIYDPGFMPELEWDEDMQFYLDVIKNGKVVKPFPASIERVFDEEFDDYLSGRIDGKALAEHLKSRVTLYLEESK